MVFMSRGQQMCWIVVIGLVVGGPIETCYGDGRYPELSNGNTIGQVVTLWGDPKEKIERELKGQVVWYYPHGAYVLFQRGKVIRWRSPSGGSMAAAQPTPKMTVAPVSTSAIDSATRDLVRDIAREIPSSPDAPYAEPPPPPPVQPAPGNFDPSQRALPQPPPGLAPGNPILPFEDDVGEE
jgi:hypothetical protein